MGSYLLVFTAAAVATAVLMPLGMRLAFRIGAVDLTREPPIPRVGGAAIAAGLSVALLAVSLVFVPTRATLLANGDIIGPVLLGGLLMLILGLVDDIRPLRASVKLGVQIAIALIMLVLGTRITRVSLPFGAFDLGPLLGGVFTVIWLVGISNAFNLLDGADGVAGGSALFSATAIFLMSVTLGHAAIGLVVAALAGALLAFLPFNFPPARAFLGDSGSMLTGFLLAGLAVQGSTKGPTLVAIAVPLVAFGVPVFDTTITLLRRLVRGRPLFEPDQEHVHHGLARAGLTPRQVVAVLYLASAAFALAAMMFINPGVRSYAVALLIIGAGVWLVVRFLRLHELNELARLAHRGVLQPRTIAMNVELRRGAERLTSAESFQDLLDALAILFGSSEFDGVLMVVWPRGDRRGRSQAWQLQHGAFAEGWPSRAPDEWEVVCPFEGSDWAGELRLRRRLGRRSLLLDFNLLLDIVQPALTQAAARLSPPLGAVAR